MPNLVVVLGGKKPGITENFPFIVRGQDYPPFPMPIKCKSESEALMINRLQSMIQRLVQEAAGPKELCQVIRCSKFIAQFSGEYHAFFLGKKPGIYCEWDGHNNGEGQVTTTSKFLRWHSFSTLRGAMIYLISKATDFLGDEEPKTYSQEYDPKPAMSPSTPVHGAQQSTNHFGTQPLASPFGAQRLTSPFKYQAPHSPTKLTASGSRPFRKGPETISMADLASDLRNVSFDHLPSLSDPLPTFVYQWDRSLDGTVIPQYTPRLQPIRRMLDFGAVVNSYLESHGYNQSSIDAIEAAVQAGRHRHDFVVFLARHMMARREAEWIYDNINWSTPQNVVEPPKCYRSSSRKLLAAALRRPFRLKKTRVTQKKTAADKRKAAEKRRERRETYQEARDAMIARIHEDAEKLHAQFGGHSIQYYKEDILQTARLKTESRAVSRWNAFLRAESQRLKADGITMKAPELTAHCKPKWNDMSEDERIAFTDPLLKELEEHRNSVTYGQRNVSLESFSDARQSLLAIEKYILAVHARTGTEIVLFASRPSTDSYLHPFATFTSDRAQDFMYNQFKLTLAETASRFEAYVLSGVEGIVHKHSSSTIELRSQLKDLINGELELLVGKARMVYVGFAEKFTMQYGVVIENWPIDRFHSPSELTRAEVNILLAAWTSKATYFRKMEKEEWDQWRNNQVESGPGLAPQASRTQSSSPPSLDDSPAHSASGAGPQDGSPATMQGKNEGPARIRPCRRRRLRR
ncbi:hypothetical protein H0H92_001795 [Tricholoma furcatifolium]|nr:hypothetical protein H0H92_001795 [Tricholoma furcatifolium]